MTCPLGAVVATPIPAEVMVVPENPFREESEERLPPPLLLLPTEPPLWMTTPPLASPFWAAARADTLDRLLERELIAPRPMPRPSSPPSPLNPDSPFL